MKTYFKKYWHICMLYICTYFCRTNIYSQQTVNPLSSIKFDNYISKMKINIPAIEYNNVEKVNLTIFDYQENVTIDTIGIKIIDCKFNHKPALTHADKTLIVIKKIAYPIVKITHINSNTKRSLNSDIGYITELKRVIDNAKNGDILFLIFNNTRLIGPKSQNSEKSDLINKAIRKNVIVVESAGNQRTNFKNDANIQTIVVGGAVPLNNDYSVSERSNFGEGVDVYGPSGIQVKDDIFFNESSSGSAVIAAIAVRLQYECKLSNHKFLDAHEMKDIFKNANSTLKVKKENFEDKLIPQYSSLLNYAKNKYFHKQR